MLEIEKWLAFCLSLCDKQKPVLLLSGGVSMLSEQQLNYAKSIINTYQKQGYKYYLCISNSDSNINVD